MSLFPGDVLYVLHKHQEPHLMFRHPKSGNSRDISRKRRKKRSNPLLKRMTDRSEWTWLCAHFLPHWLKGLVVFDFLYKRRRRTNEREVGDRLGHQKGKYQRRRRKKLIHESILFPPSSSGWLVRLFMFFSSLFKRSLFFAKRDWRHSATENSGHDSSQMRNVLID